MQRRNMLLTLIYPALSGCVGPPLFVDDASLAAHYDYYYYPHLSVYFHLYSGYYYYRDRDTWVRARSLPPHIHLDPRLRHRLVIRDPKPYARWPEHRQTYRRAPGWRPEPRYDRDEREHNRNRFDEYSRRRR